jgi:hypothetical protein
MAAAPIPPLVVSAMSLLTVSGAGRPEETVPPHGTPGFPRRALAEWFGHEEVLG